MFTGIIRQLATIEALRTEQTNLVLTFKCNFPADSPIQIDQSIAHNGVCLTITNIIAISPDATIYEVVAIEETLQKTTLSKWKVGESVNVELCMRVGDRLDGHFVQGHVDGKGKVVKIEEKQGSWELNISFAPEHANLLVNKGSVTINGVSLTVVEAHQDSFSVALLPYTFSHTQFQFLKMGDEVNLEFDILGKYFLRQQSLLNP